MRRNRHGSTIAAGAAVALGLLTVPLRAQAAASLNYFLPAMEQSQGGSAASAAHVVLADFGAGLTPLRGSAGNFVITGGFPTAVDTPTTGRPWVTGVEPQFPVIRGGTPHTIFGTGLDIGAQTTVQIGSVPAVVNNRTTGTIDVTMPHVPEGGFNFVRVTNGGGTCNQPDALAVLPMAESDGPFRNKEFNRLRFRGKQGDTIIWLFADAPISPVSLLPYEGFYRLNLFTITLSQGFDVTRPDGVIYFDLPVIDLNVLVFIQTFVFSNHPGYAPGGFTNLTFVSPFH